MLTSASVYAQDFCQSDEVKALMDPTSECHEIISLNKVVPKSATCTGYVMGNIPCLVNYNARSSYATMSFSCGEDPLNPIVKRFMVPEITSYQYSAVFKGNDNQEESILNDQKSYLNLSGESLNINVMSENVDGVIKKTTEIIILGNGSIPITNVRCF